MRLEALVPYALYDEITYLVNYKRATYEIGRGNCQKNEGLVREPA